MSVLDLLLSRQALAAGVGMTTRRNKVLPGAIDDQAIGERTGIGKPKFDTPATEIVEDRTFVFSVFNGTVATIANRIAGSTGLRVVRTGMAVAAATYCIGALKTFVSKWRDCWRIDANTFGINGNVPPDTVGVGVVPTHERSSLPYVANDGGYYPTCIGDATRSTLFIAKAQELMTPRVLSISTTGTQKSILTASNSVSTAYSGAGARLDAENKFRFYAMNLSQAANAVFYLYPGWSVIQATRASPYLQQLAYAATLSLQVRGNPYLAAYNGINYAGANAHTTESFSITPTLCPFYLGSTVTARRYPATYTMEWDEIRDDLYYLTPGDYTDDGLSTHTSTAISRLVDSSVAAYAYVGADIQLALVATLQTDYTSDRKYAVKYHNFTSGGSTSQFSGGSHHVVSAESATKTVLALSSQLAAIGELTYIEVDVTGDYSCSDVYTPTVVSVPGLGSTSTYLQEFYNAENLAAAIAVQEAEGYGKLVNPATLSAHDAVRSNQRGTTLLARTRDYIYADIDEDIFLSLNATLTFDRDETYNFSTSTWTPVDVYSLVIKYVLRVRGTTYEFPVYSGGAGSFTAPKVETASIFSGDASQKPLENYHGLYHTGYKPLPIFSPPFMAQGNCPYIAYTTKAEELDGAPAEFYLDISIKILLYTTFTGTRYDGIVPIVPHQFLAMFRRYIGGETKDAYPTYPLTQNTTLWDALFPTATPFRIQFANGVAGAWNTALGAPFTSNPTTEITRI